ncbi:unnamed protein product, partial [Mesorhabditis belari]|uniref:Uncharacterized protein n=1 Tax=Mesorhabditis belari TaxID=2138241 RepID=A0AAF3FS01_9BILA
MESDLSKIDETTEIDSNHPENQQFFRKFVTKTDTEQSLAGSRQASKQSLFSGSASQSDSLKSIDSVVRVGQDRLSDALEDDLEEKAIEKSEMNNSEVGSTTNLLVTVDSISIGSLSSPTKDHQSDLENSFGAEPVDKVVPDNALEQIYRLNLTHKDPSNPVIEHPFKDSDDELLEELAQNSKKALAAMQSKSKRKKKEEMTRKLMDNQARLGLKMTTAKEKAQERKKQEAEQDQEENVDCRCDAIRKDPRLKTKVCVLM